MDLFLLAENGSNDLTVAWITAGAAFLAALIGCIPNLIVHISNRKFAKEQAENASKQNQLMLQLDRFFKTHDDNVARSREELNLLAHYAIPLTTAIDAVFYRLSEIVDKNDTIDYFSSEAPNTSFVEYKRMSTLYRFAALFGWLRAFKLEQSLLSVMAVKNLSQHVANLERAFADGHLVDSRRADFLVEGKQIPEETKTAIAKQLSVLLQDSLAEHGGVKSHELNSLERDKKVVICERAVRVVNQVSGLSLTTPNEEGIDKMIRRIGVRESWIYRDWQDAIGELMLVETQNSTRRFNVIDFGTFETKSSVQSHVSDMGKASLEVWIPRLQGVFDDLDMSDRTDARTYQLKSVLRMLEELKEAVSAAIGKFENENRRAIQ